MPPKKQWKNSATERVKIMSNSTLAKYTKLSPNCTKPRNHAIDTITIHCMAGNCSIETCGDIFAPTSRQASSNYGIGSDGRIALYVDEANQIIGIDLSAYAKTANLHPPVSLGLGSETELALNPTTQVITLTGLKKTFLSLNDTFDAYPTQGYGNGLIAGTSAVNYSNSFGVDGEGFWAKRNK